MTLSLLLACLGDPGEESQSPCPSVSLSTFSQKRGAEMVYFTNHLRPITEATGAAHRDGWVRLPGKGWAVPH